MGKHEDSKSPKTEPVKPDPGAITSDGELKAKGKHADKGEGGKK